MIRLRSTPSLFALAAAVGTFAAAGAAHARSDVQFSIGVHVPGYVQPAPVYVQPRPYYVQPRPRYVQPQPYYVQPQPYYVQPQPYYAQPGRVEYGWHGKRRGRGGPWGDWDRDGVPNKYDRDSRWYEGPRYHGGGGGWGERDRDRDGVPNRYDRAPRNPYYY